MPTIMAAMNTSRLLNPKDSAASAGPGQNPSSPHPTPQNTAPPRRRVSTLRRDSIWSPAGQSGPPRRRASNERGDQARRDDEADQEGEGGRQLIRFRPQQSAHDAADPGHAAQTEQIDRRGEADQGAADERRKRREVFHCRDPRPL